MLTERTASDDAAAAEGSSTARLRCDYCPRTYSAPETLRRHRRIHTQGRCYRCAKCNVSFARQDVLQRHVLQIHHGNGGAVRASTILPARRAEQVGGGSPSSSGRKRSIKACDACWRRKERCSIGDPDASTSCNRCEANGVPCTYRRRSARVSLQANNDDDDGDEDDDEEEERHANRGDTSVLDDDHAGAAIAVLTPSSTSWHDQHDFDPAYPTSPLPLPVLSPQPELPTQQATAQVSSRGASVFLNESWDWILDEFVPSTPMMVSRMASPRLYPTIEALTAAVGQDCTAATAGNAFYATPHPLPPPAVGHVPDNLASLAAATNLEQLAAASVHLAASSNNDVDMAAALMASAPQRRPLPEQDGEEHLQACVFAVVQACIGSLAAGEVVEDKMRTLSAMVMQTFQLSVPLSAATSDGGGGGKHLFRWYVDLFFEHFHPLWPLFPVSAFRVEACPAHLYLTLAIIGAQYGSGGDARFGRMAHEVFRTLLITTWLDLRTSNESSESLCHTLLLNVAIALYLGQQRAFFIAQQMSTVLILHSQRIKLFAESAREEQTASSTATPQRTPWPYPRSCQDEVRRRLAFGVLRLDAYVSILLGQRPRLGWEDVRIGLLHDPQWWTWAATTDGGAAAEMQRAASTTVRGTRPPCFSAVVRQLMHGTSGGALQHASLRPVDLELILMAMVSEVRILGQQRDAMQPHYDSITDFDLRRKHDEESRQRSQSISTTSTAAGAKQTYALLPPPPVRASQSSGQVCASLAASWSRTLDALERWRATFGRLQQQQQAEGTCAIQANEEQTLFNCRILYHAVMLHLFADIGELHGLSMLDTLHDESTTGTAKAVLRWAKTADATSSVQQAAAIIDALESGLSDSEASRLNFVSYVCLYHSAVVLWTYSQLNVGDYSDSSSVTVAGYALTPGNTRALMMHVQSIYPRFRSHWPIVANFFSALTRLSERRLPESMLGG